tara:strand:+ start:1334 stop:1615 length:282 start_codon:yes stop_codon:yes gene_type:complete
MNYTSGNKAPTQMAQAPNKKGNVSKTQPDPKHSSGVTAVTGSNKRGLNQPKGAQGAPKGTGVVHAGCHCPVSVMRPKDTYGSNDSYRNSSYTK